MKPNRIIFQNPMKIVFNSMRYKFARMNQASNFLKNIDPHDYLVLTLFSQVSIKFIRHNYLSDTHILYIMTQCLHFKNRIFILFSILIGCACFQSSDWKKKLNKFNFFSGRSFYARYLFDCAMAILLSNQLSENFRSAPVARLFRSCKLPFNANYNLYKVYQ